MKVCPDCITRPARDQRDATQDGRCVSCHNTATGRPNAAPRKQRQHSEQPVMAEAYV